MSELHRTIGLALILAAFLLGGFGVWAIASADLQGGRAEGGGVFLAIGALAFVSGTVILAAKRGG